jgi:16S rRNA (guanine527-N7)-methyltransferase
VATLTDDRIGTLLQPYLPDASPGLCSKLSIYLDLLLRWNARTNLTAIRDPEEIVQRHFGESLFTAAQLPPATTLLDFGSGAGFPGLPIQLFLPDLAVTLAESQGKKASFLREAVRVLDLQTEVWPSRVEAMPQGRNFTVVALRAVDNMDSAIAEANRRVLSGGTLAILGGAEILPEFPTASAIKIPGSAETFLYLQPC